jgi:ribonuclease G
MFSLKYKWKKKYGVGMKIIPDQSLGFCNMFSMIKIKTRYDLKEEIEMK